MVRVLLYLFVFACLAVGAVWLADRPGEVSVLWQGYRIETSVAIAAIGVVVLAMLAMLAWAVLLDWLFWRAVPDAYTLAGGAIIIASGIYLIRREAPREMVVVPP